MGVKNHNQDYEKWDIVKAKNEVIANTDTTPSAASDFWGKWNASVGSAANAAANGANLAIQHGVVSPGNVDASGAPIGSPTTPYTETEDFRNWVAEKGFTYENGKINTNPTVTTPTTTTPEASGTVNEETKTETKTPVITQTPTEGGFAKWIETDPAMQARMRQAESDYYRNRAGYGVQGENLAQSGLIGSGWDSHMDATAYAAMQAEKAGVHSEGYAKWLGDQEAAKAEGTANDERLNTDAQSVFSFLVDQGKEKVTDADLSYFYGLGFSKDAIDKAVTAYNDYSAKNKSEVSNTFKDSLNTLMGEGTAADFLGSLGVSTEGMTEDEINATTDAAIEQAFKDGTLTAEDRSAYYKAGQILDEDTSLWGLKEMAEKTANSVANAKTYLDEGKITQADYDEIVKTAYDKLGVSEIKIGVEGETFTSATDIKVTVNVNGNKRTYTFDRAGKMQITDKEYEGALSRLFGDSPLAVYNGKCYFQYQDGEWTEIGVKAESKGDKSEGNDVLRVIAEYVAGSGMKAVKEGNRTYIR